MFTIKKKIILSNLAVVIIASALVSVPLLIQWVFYVEL